MAFCERLCERTSVFGAEMPRSRTLMLLVWEETTIASHSTAQAGVDQMAWLEDAARRARRMNSTVWMVKRRGAIHATIAKKTDSRQEPSAEHPNEGVAAERAIAATRGNCQRWSAGKIKIKNDKPV